MPNLARLFKRFCTAGTNGHLDLCLSWQVSEDPLERPEIHGKLRRVLLPVGKDQLAGCLKVWVSGLLEWDAVIQ